MKFWIDECLTPALVGRAYSHGYEATCTRDRGYLGMRDDELLAFAVGEEFVFVTNNHADVMGLCANAELHTGLLVLPQRPREAQLLLFSDAITHIESQAAQTREAPSDWMLNRVVGLTTCPERAGIHLSPATEARASTKRERRGSIPSLTPGARDRDLDHSATRSLSGRVGRAPSRSSLASGGCRLKTALRSVHQHLTRKYQPQRRKFAALSAVCGRGHRLIEQVGHRLAGCETLCGLAELFSCDRALRPAVEDLDDGRAGLQALGPYRPHGIPSHMCTGLHYLP